DISLIQIPGKLIITSDTKGLDIEIDGRKENYIGGEEKSFVKYGTTVAGKKEFQLLEGKYSLTIKKEGVSQPFQFKIDQNKDTFVNVIYDKHTKVIEITNGK
ncbi:MAG: hypothetical protein JXJ04_05550, partial [Spirochaetales bacterium]|nr:hypothetical protein [Spirochaetales bacterium]